MANYLRRNKKQAISKRSLAVAAVTSGEQEKLMAEVSQRDTNNKNNKSSAEHPKCSIMRYIVGRWGRRDGVKLPNTQGGMAFAKALSKRGIVVDGGK